MAIIPVARSMYLCDRYFSHTNATVDLFGVFNAIKPDDGYPFVRRQICVFTQLANGLGDLTLQVDMRFANTGKLVYSSEVRRIVFEDRTTIVQAAILLPDCPFSRRGRYLFELFCDNTWVSDTYLELE